MLVATLAAALGCLLTAVVHAHTLPLSHVVVRADDHGLEVTIEAPAIDFAHDLPQVTPDTLLTPAGADAHKDQIAAIAATRFKVQVDDALLPLTLLGAESLKDRMQLRLRLGYAWVRAPVRLHIECRLFPYDARHQTFLDLYRNGTLVRQAIFDRDTTQIDDVAAARQQTVDVVRRFVIEGIHHIAIGPDHILFVVGLLLLGGTVAQLLRVVTAFTAAHSITLALATLGIVTPPARIVEPMIALSIIFVGVHSLLADRGSRDLRLAFAFAFGLIHGFGFASVLREMELPRAALGWSLLSFNLGVELGQAGIVLTVAPALALLRRRRAQVADHVVAAGAFGVICAGSFWFAQRLFGAP